MTNANCLCTFFEYVDTREGVYFTLDFMMVRYAVASAIVGYQRWISPHKGYSCAHRVLNGGSSCSEFGRKVVLRFGLLRFLLLQRRRFTRCAHAYAVLQANSSAKSPDAKEPEYKEFPWKQCAKGGGDDLCATGCSCFLW